MTTLKEIDDKYYQYCNVVMLPTNEKSNLLLNSFNGRLATENNNPLHEKSKQWEYQHIYITSNEEIKTGDWYITNTEIHQKMGGITGTCHSKKIIATTNLLLKIHKFKKGVLKNLEYNLPQLPQQFIEKFIEAYNNNVGIDEVLVENEKATYEKWIKNGATPVFDTLKVNSDNTINVKLIKESYTKDELIAFGLKCVNLGMDLNNNPLPRLNEISGKEFYYKWVEENL